MKRATITKRPYTYKGKTEDRWVVLWTDSTTGKRRENGKFQSKRRAEEFANKIDRDIEQEIHEAGSGKITFGAMWKGWIADCEQDHRLGDLAGNTLKNRHWGGDYILPEFGQRQIGKITTVDVEALLKKLREGTNGKKRLEHKSLDNLYGFIFAVFKYAVRKKKLAANPLVNDPAKIPGERKRRRKSPPFEDMETLIQILHQPAPPWCHAITWANQKIAFALRAFAGLRGGEIAALRWDTIDLPGAKLSVPEKDGTVSMIDGLKKPKSAAGVRDIPMGQYLYDELLEHGRATDMKGFVIKPQCISRGNGEGFLRTRQAAGDVYLSSQAISDMHHDLMVRAKLTKPDGKVKFVGHDLRHWWFSVRIAMGHNLVAVSKQGGHYDPTVTMKIYADVIEGAEDGLKDSVPPIWHQRFARAEPGRPTMIEGAASESESLPLIIDGTATRLLETPIPENAYPWVPEAVRLLEGGWRPSDVTRHLGIARATLWVAFKRLGLPTPEKIRVKVRDRKFEELRDAGYTDKQIAQKLNCSVGTVFHWRLTKEEGVPNTRAEFRRLMTGKSNRAKLTDEQVLEVWDRLDAGESFAKIAKRFSVSHGLIGNIKAGRNYQWVKQKREKNEGAPEPDKSLEFKEKLTPSQVAETEKLRESQLKLL